MPELPEAETIVRGLRPHLEHRRIRGTEVFHEDVLDDPPPAFAAAVRDRDIRQVGRRGKNVVVSLEAGDRLVVNLGMSGRLLHRRPDDHRPPPTHPAVRFLLDDASALVYHDVRRFGRLRVLSAGAFREWSGTLGPEPLSRAFTSRRLARALAESRSPIRSWLLDQRRVAGVGNIYANEALHRARIHPRTPANRIDREGATRLHRALRKVLRDAVHWRGTTFRDFRTADGAEGSYAPRLGVYGREDEPCPRCATTVRREVFGNRSAFFCPRCQPSPAEDA